LELQAVKGEDARVSLFREIGEHRRMMLSLGTKIRQGRLAARVFLGEFGLTPASTGRVRLPDPNEERDAFSEFELPDPNEGRDDDATH